MSRKYYYLVTSLPMLEFLGKLPMTSQEFIDDCERILDPKDFFDLQMALSSKPKHSLIRNASIREWLDLGRRFKNEIAWFRAIEANKEPTNFIRGDRYVEPYFVHVVIEASKAENPLEAQKVLDRARWQKIDELEQGHMFDLEFLICYGFKLQLVERYHIIQSSKGKSVFDGYKEMELPKLELA